MLTEQYPFKGRVQQICHELSKLEQLQLPEPLTWTVDWSAVEQGTPVPDFFSALRAKKSDPAVYVFSMKPEQCEAVFDGFRRMRNESAIIRANVGLRHKDYRNICHVPEQLLPSSCLYIGSRKSDCNSRIQQHLGLTKGGQTGAMYL